MWRGLLCGVMAVWAIQVAAQTPPADANQAGDAQIAARIAELSSDKNPLPTNIGTLYDLIRGVDAEMSDWRSRSEVLLKDKANVPDLEGLRKRIIGLFGNIAALDCKSASHEVVSNYMAELREGYRMISQVILEHQYQVPGAAEFTDASLKSLSGCESLKSLVGDAKRQDAGIDLFTSMKAQRDADSRRIEQSLGQIDKLSRLLQERKWAIQTAIAEKSAQQQLSSSLWKVISVIGLFSIGAILVVRLFSVPLQLEWVATGQVIQFVTVMILLSVLMALGLAGILEQNILGTLLGGIAGHVLAQGVGRSAAHEARRDKTPKRGEGSREVEPTGPGTA